LRFEAGEVILGALDFAARDGTVDCGHVDPGGTQPDAPLAPVHRLTPPVLTPERTLNSEDDLARAHCCTITARWDTCEQDVPRLWRPLATGLSALHRIPCSGRHRRTGTPRCASASRARRRRLAPALRSPVDDPLPWFELAGRRFLSVAGKQDLADRGSGRQRLAGEVCEHRDRPDPVRPAVLGRRQLLVATGPAAELGAAQ